LHKLQADFPIKNQESIGRNRRGSDLLGRIFFGLTNRESSREAQKLKTPHPQVKQLEFDHRTDTFPFVH